MFKVWENETRTWKLLFADLAPHSIKEEIGKQIIGFKTQRIVNGLFNRKGTAKITVKMDKKILNSVLNY